VIAGIRRSFYFPSRSVYMGLYPGVSDQRRRRIPGIRLASRVVTAWIRYLTGRCHRMRRRLVLFDRYTYDALLSPPPRGLAHARRWLLAHTCPPPDLVVVLDASGELLYRRKHEHSVSWLDARRRDYLSLQTAVPRFAVVDATRDRDEVRRTVTGLIWQLYLRRNSLDVPPTLPPGGDLHAADAITHDTVLVEDAGPATARAHGPARHNA
jgi:hypothetical protein